MNGRGLDRHLFAFYVISKGLDYVSIQGLYEWQGLDRHLFALYVISKGLDYVSIQGLYEWQGPGQTSVCIVCYQQGT